jgi:hypothetical protein
MPYSVRRPVVILLVVALLLAACALGPGRAGTPLPTSPATLPVASPTTAAVGVTTTVGPENTATATGPGDATATAAPATIAPTRGGGAITDSENNGCPEPQAPTTAGAKADLVVGTNGGAGGGAVTMVTGQVLEVRLAPVVRWSLVIQDPNGVLLPADHNGWYDAGAQVCVWRFTAKSAGTASLAFSGRPICAAGKACPQYILESNYTVTVQG